jgi:hypothetical protein
MWEGKEIARFECTVEPVAKSLRNTKVIFSGSFRERSIAEIQIAGERVKHILRPMAARAAVPVVN